MTAIRSRAEDGGWLCVLRFDRPISVGLVVDDLARQAVVPSARPLPDAPVDLRVVNPIGFVADVEWPTCRPRPTTCSSGRRRARGC